MSKEKSYEFMGKPVTVAKNGTHKVSAKDTGGIFIEAIVEAAGIDTKAAKAALTSVQNTMNAIDENGIVYAGERVKENKCKKPVTLVLGDRSMRTAITMSPTYECKNVSTGAPIVIHGHAKIRRGGTIPASIKNSDAVIKIRSEIEKMITG